MSIEFQQLVQPVACAGRARFLGPKDAGFTEAFSSLLDAEGYLDGAAIARARRAAEVAGERFDLVLVKLGLISEADLCQVYAAYCGLRVMGEAEIPARPVLADRLRHAFLRTNRILPIAHGNGRILIASADPFIDDVVRAVSYMLDLEVELALIVPAEIERALRTLYNDPAAEGSLEEAAVAVQAAGDGSEDAAARVRDIANEAPIIRLVNQVIARAVERGASDVHIEPGRDAVAIRYRVDGFLQQERTVPTTSRAALTTRVKIMAKLDIAERRLPQDGRIKTVVRGVEIDIRVSTIPTAFGESVVLRILDRTRVELDFAKLGLGGTTEAGLRRLMSLPNGIVLVTGPTGSGKTTTLYTALKNLNRPELKLFTVEDPIEYQLPGINQVQVQPQIGFDFPVALRSILRQDPDIVMIGEIRDLETARIAIQAALTGHLVFSTLHTNSAIAAITRLIDIGLERYLLASTIAGVMAQRLVRKLCPSCSRPFDDSHRAQHPRELAVPSERSRPALSNRRVAVGCSACGNVGYLGRTTISELLIIDDELRHVVGRRSDDQRMMEQLARNAGFRSLYEDGLLKVEAGETSLEEVLRVTRAA